MNSIVLLLEGLDCPIQITSLKNCEQVANLVAWLEDRVIRHLDVDQRAPLKFCPDQDSIVWEASFNDYLNLIGSPFSWTCSTKLECLHWLVSHAIIVEYEFNAESCIDYETNNLLPTHQFAELDNLGSILNVMRKVNETDIEYCRRISHKIRMTLTSGSLDYLMTHDSNNCENELSSFPLGFATPDELVNKVAVVLKMLHLRDLRELQDDLNALIILGQEHCSNPRTNVTLGQIGR